MTEDRFVELDRDFTPLELARKYGLDDLEMLDLFGSRGLKWSDLLERARVVVLAGAESGKTEEFKERVRLLRDEKRFAQYVTIERIAESGLEVAMTLQQRRDFAGWVAGGEPGWFFLDSVDEARINHKDVETALNRFAISLGAGYARASVVLSCRGSAWEGETDLALIQRTLPVLPEDPPPGPVDPDEALFAEAVPETRAPLEDEGGREPDTSVMIVAMAKLSAAQRARFVEKQEVGDAGEFLRTVRQNGLEHFSERPGDLRGLARYWKRHGKFGSFSEMTEFGVTERLREHDSDREGARLVTDIEARAAVERLAAAMTLAQTMELVLRSEQSDDPDGVDPYLVLGDWKPGDVTALLQRGLFVPATFGRRRFYHRSAQEYLTACWFKRLKLPDTELYAILLADVCGIRTVPLSLRAAAAWMAADHQGLREHILEREPLLLMAEGDPARLSIPDRIQLLRTFSERQRDGQAPFRYIDDRSLWMFADDRLAPAILEALEINSRREFQLQMVQLVELGAIAACRDAVRKIATNPEGNPYLRTTALQALVVLADHEGLADAARRFLAQPDPLDRTLAPAFAMMLFPEHFSVGQLLEIIRRMKPARRHQLEGFRDELGEIFASSPDPGSEYALIEGLAELAFLPPLSDYPPISRRYGTLVDQLGPLTRAAILAHDSTAPTAGLVRLIRAVAMAREDQHEGPTLRALVASRPELNRTLFLADLASAAAGGKDIRRLHHLSAGAPAWSLSAKDTGWLEVVMTSVDLPGRLVALEGLLLLSQHDGSTANVARIESLVAGDPVLADAFATARRPAELDEEMVKFQRRQAQQEAEAAERRRARRVAITAFRDRMQADPGQLCDEEKLREWAGVSPLVQLTEWLRQGDRGRGYEGAALQWRKLAPAFGTAVAAAYRDGMTRLWRITPAARPTVSDRGLTSRWDVILSCAGIGVEAAADPCWVDKLSPDEVTRAAEHACLDDRTMPAWLSTLLKADPGRVVPHVEAELVREWRTATDYAPFLEHAAHRMALVPQLQRVLARMISGSPPGTVGRIETAAEIVAKLDLTLPEREEMLAMAQDRLAAAVSAEDAAATRAYLRLIFRLDAATGLDALEDLLDALGETSRWRESFSILRALFDRHRGSVVEPATLGPAVVSRLTERAYVIAGRMDAAPEMRIDDDTRVAVPDGEQSLLSEAEQEGADEDDQSFDIHDPRDALLSGLVHLDGEDAYEAVRTLAERPVMQPIAHHIRERAREIAERMADRAPWSEVEVREFEARRLAPIARGSDLLDLVCSLIDTIDWEFRKADMSARAVVETARDEEAVQEWLGSTLEQKGGGRFRCVREAQVADNRRPDIIVTATQAAIEVAIEMKHDDKGWTLPDLGDALTNQLAERYLQPADRRHGVLVVTNHRDAKFWRDHVSGERVGFEAAIARLSDQAARIRTNSAGAIRVAVRGIDASPARRAVDQTKSARKADGRQVMASDARVR